MDLAAAFSGSRLRVEVRPQLFEEKADGEEGQDAWP
jgi:hypothetical protein